MRDNEKERSVQVASGKLKIFLTELSRPYSYLIDYLSRIK
jgi:hypothetical protein